MPDLSYVAVNNVIEVIFVYEVSSCNCMELFTASTLFVCVHVFVFFSASYFIQLLQLQVSFLTCIICIYLPTKYCTFLKMCLMCLYCQACEALKLNAAKLGNTADSVKKNAGSSTADAEDDDKEYRVSGELVQTSTVERPPESSIHTNYDLLNTVVS